MYAQKILATMLVSLCGMTSIAAAQTVSPMEKHITSFTDKFFVQVMIKNPYKSAEISEIEVFDKNWTPIKGVVLSKRRTLLGAGQNLTITALVPFNGAKKTQIYLCHAITPGNQGRGTAYRGEVCGKYIARRLSV